MALTKIDDRGLKTPIDLLDNEKIRLGTGNDLELFHDGSASNIKDTGTGHINLWSNEVRMIDAGGSEYMFRAFENGAVELYHGMSGSAAEKKFETTSAGGQITGRLNINTSTDGHAAANELTIENTAADMGMTLRSGTGNQGAIYFSDGTSGDAEYRGIVLYNHANDAFSIYTSATESLRVDSDGNVAIKNNDVKLSGSGTLRINSGSTAGALNLDGGATNHGGEINLLGGSNGGRIIFRTGVGSGQQGENMRLDENGRLLLGTTTEGDSSADNLTIADSGESGITVRSGTSNGGHLYFSDATSGSGEYQGGISYQHNDDFMKFMTSASERMRINSDGTLSLGITGAYDTGKRLSIGHNDHAVEIRITDSSNVRCMTLRHGRASGGTGGEQITFEHSGGGTVGTIESTGSATSFNTSSDYRLKENITAISDGITRLKTLKPSRFNFKVDKDTTVDGFLAHEVTAVPEAVKGTKDEVATTDDDAIGLKKGDPIYQRIDHSKLVPLLTAALQEAITEIETLKTKVAALEAA